MNAKMNANECDEKGTQGACNDSKKKMEKWSLVFSEMIAMLCFAMRETGIDRCR